MRTMNAIVHEYLTKHGKRSFDQIYEHVKQELLPVWQKRFSDYDEEQIDSIKVAELYMMLTVQGSFARQNDDLWILRDAITYEELKQSKIKVPENID